MPRSVDLEAPRSGDRGRTQAINFSLNKETPNPEISTVSKPNVEPTADTATAPRPNPQAQSCIAYLTQSILSWTTQESKDSPSQITVAEIQEARKRLKLRKIIRKPPPPPPDDPTPQAARLKDWLTSTPATPRPPEEHDTPKARTSSTDLADND